MGYEFSNSKRCLKIFWNYFRRFVRDYAVIAKYLTNLLKKNKLFEITDEVLLACKQMKEALINAPVISLYKPGVITEVQVSK